MSRRGFLQRAGDGVSQLPLFADHSASFAAGGHLQLANGLPFAAGANPFSYAMWFNLDGGAGANSSMLISWLSASSTFANDLADYYYDAGLGIPRGLWIDTAGGNDSCGGNLPGGLNSWQFEVLTYDGNITLDHFIYPGPTHTSVGMAAQWRANTHGSDTPFWIGDEPRTIAGVTHWSGRIDSLGIWRRRLTQVDGDALYNAGAGLQYIQQAPVAVRSNILCWYAFDEPTGSATWFDTSGNGNHLSAVGTVHSGGKRGT